ncbi:MAG: hypothetical protein A3G49_05435 [Candidatus Sungbacteria bacterium RIFCSPLOWO2_12_FULL_41_11]|uniref:Uncharacterized protein n=1 Tax=Candidatus Sungbacteria bacterium RIFCSPLOWO2_12_FULL_41_11 TaxID=1802286 RepID=A0A1G2LSI0_9BACT|nr:MAG: hypothetical protein UV01_C0008G0062 [Parcubacteria group bacterium GW2011_GWA2_42_14]OGZ98376.1 MAG: hypothetical protein A3D41_00060 [Candidatus Sungbacteria bacterium RIFCSPHIGHO2_02_FULL_41_12b]OHA14605.1 MAG: hypothetical protein A3G49_05435 [Candidatus Sungbacteria bacterium RIFCSPLOWO2_12_FULL_41_11]
MNTITIPKKEYQELVEKRIRYDYLRQMMERDLFSPPPEKNRKKIVSAFKVAEKYNQKFLKSLEKGIKRSSYFNS